MNRDERRVVVLGYTDVHDRKGRTNYRVRKVARTIKDLEMLTKEINGNLWLAFETEGGKLLATLAVAQEYLNG